MSNLRSSPEFYKILWRSDSRSYWSAVIKLIGAGLVVHGYPHGVSRKRPRVWAAG